MGDDELTDMQKKKEGGGSDVRKRVTGSRWGQCKEVQSHGERQGVWRLVRERESVRERMEEWK